MHPCCTQFVHFLMAYAISILNIRTKAHKMHVLHSTSHPLCSSPQLSNMSKLIKLIPLPTSLRRRSGVPSTKSNRLSSLPPITVLPGVLDISQAAVDALGELEEDASQSDLAPEWLAFDDSTLDSLSLTTGSSSRRPSSCTLPQTPLPSRAPSCSCRRLPVPLPIPPMPKTPSPRPPTQANQFVLDSVRDMGIQPSLHRNQSYPLPRHQELDVGRKASFADSLASSADESLMEAFPLPPQATFTKRISPQALLRQGVNRPRVCEETGPLIIVKRDSGMSSGRSSVATNRKSESTMDDILQSLDDVYAAFKNGAPSSSEGLADLDMALPPVIVDIRGTWPVAANTRTQTGPYSFLVTRVQSLQSFGTFASGSRSMPDLVNGAF
ncbi:hypothetical protein MIND_00211500 [Mycena indigotica]|uniref:Uncharacterized protein n=1 Tax=Mycena indigotica TaxID=2126181 RepID=A0A8H6T867_9AGAR|nr:uncharacterized protein MIND_00211500 [Mycena indigotica]KAF7311996.1 hypothetical protein MIND_00211500 [Mycena indigotica]